ncbi:MAG TPA: type II secretion system minor pseudopilin GspJ [Gammaproteobacteria bacterium]|nr:type II secretion system minor pseudopilin GspJ [Gammaproteobacteria bacterium]
MRAARGFTLLELVVAVAVFGLLAAMAYGGLSAVLEARATTEAHSERLAALQRTWSLLESDLYSIVARPVRDGYGDPLPPLAAGLETGTAVAFSRLTWGVAGPVRSRVQRVGYRLEDGALVRLVWPVADRAPDTRAQTMRLLPGVERATLRLLGPEGRWQETWPPAGSPRALPRALELTLEVEGWGELSRLFVLPAAE